MRIATFSPPSTISSKQNVVLVDGFPRSLENFHQYEQQIGVCSSLLVIDCPQKEIIDRVLSRGLTSGRADDQSKETILNRIKVFETETEQVISNYSSFSLPGVNPHETNDILTQIAASKASRVAVRIPGNFPVQDVSLTFRGAIDALLRRSKS